MSVQSLYPVDQDVSLPEGADLGAIRRAHQAVAEINRIVDAQPENDGCGGYCVRALECPYKVCVLERLEGHMVHQRYCVTCGKRFTQRSANQKYCHDPCGLKTWRLPRPLRSCRVCGREIPPAAHGLVIYCQPPAPCAQLADAAKRAEREARYTAERKRKGCRVCGEPLPKDVPDIRYHPGECREIGYRRVAEAANARVVEARRAERQAANVLNPRPCQVCGKDLPADLDARTIVHPGKCKATRRRRQDSARKRARYRMEKGK